MLEARSDGHAWPHVRVKVAGGRVDGSALVPGQDPNQPPSEVYLREMVVPALGRMGYYEPRQGFSLAKIVRQPMFLMIAATVRTLSCGRVASLIGISSIRTSTRRGLWHTSCRG